MEQAPTNWERVFSRVLISGSPNSGKTTSLATWPGPLTVISAPGEKGISAVPAFGGDGKPIRSLLPELPENPTLAAGDWEASVKNELAREGLVTIAIEGLHKLFPLYLAWASGGASTRGEDFDGRKVWPRAGDRFIGFVNMIQASQVPNVVFSVWDGIEKDDPDDKSNNATRHIFPELPGQLAKRIMGEFSLTLYATKDPAGRHVWYTLPQGKVWGAAIKIPPTLRAKIPPMVDQDWGKLISLIRALKG